MVKFFCDGCQKEINKKTTYYEATFTPKQDVAALDYIEFGD